MSDFSEESSDKQDEKDDDFNIDDHRSEVDSDDSYDNVPKTTNDNNAPSGSQDNVEEEHENEYIGPVLPAGHRFDRKFVCILYPGNVINPDKAIETMGGIGNMSTAVNTPNRRIELRFRPDDTYCKPACGDRVSNMGFLLRVRVKKSDANKAREAEARGSKKQSAGDSNLNSDNVDKTQLPELKKSKTQDDIQQHQSQEEREMTDLVTQVESCTVSTGESSAAKASSESLPSERDKDVWNTAEKGKGGPKIRKNIPPTFDPTKYKDLSEDADYELPKLKVLGQVDTEFRFKNLCDFQYLPMTPNKTAPDTLECIYDKIYPVNIPKFSWLKTDVPYFLPPAVFSRMDTVQQYVPKTEVDSLPENIIGKNKKRKMGFTNFIYFSTADVPTKAPAGIETAMLVKFVLDTHMQQMREIFEERPIWSKNALVYKTRLSNDRLKILLPSVAYYFVNGPWKIMWVKLGYDPRKDSSARIYQTLDYRLKSMHGLGSTVKCKRNYSEYTLPYKSAPTSKKKTTILKPTMSHEQAPKKEQVLSENVYIYREGMVPPSRQMFYQYCDVLVDEIQEMMAKLPDPLPGTKCHEKRGWLPSGFDVQCREIINKQVRAVLRKQMNIPDDHPTSMPRKRKYYKLKQNTRKRKRRKKTESITSDTEESEEQNEITSPVPGTSAQST